MNIDGDDKKIIDLYYFSDKVFTLKEIEKQSGCREGSLKEKRIKEIAKDMELNISIIKKVRGIFNRKTKDKKIIKEKSWKFDSFQSFYNWYKKEYEEGKGCCSYCGISEEVVRELVIQEILKSARFPKNGKPARGRSRGLSLEVDRKKPENGYESGNCALCCYFCNNDKSDVFTDVEYQEFFQNRSEYLRKLYNSKESK